MLIEPRTTPRQVLIVATAFLLSAPSELGLPWGQIPVLEIDGVKYGQSLACARYLARKYGLTGKNELEELKCDEIIDSFRDFQSSKSMRQLICQLISY